MINMFKMCAGVIKKETKKEIYDVERKKKLAHQDIQRKDINEKKHSCALFIYFNEKIKFLGMWLPS